MRGASLCPVKTQCGNRASVKPQPSSENEQNPPWGRKTWVLTLNPSMPGISRHKIETSWQLKAMVAHLLTGHSQSCTAQLLQSLYQYATYIHFACASRHSTVWTQLSMPSQHSVNTPDHVIPAQGEHTWPCYHIVVRTQSIPEAPQLRFWSLYSTKCGGFPHTPGFLLLQKQNGLIVEHKNFKIFSYCSSLVFKY